MLAGIFIVAAIPFVYAIYWANALLAWKRRRDCRRDSHLLWVLLFSGSARRREFSGLIALLLTLCLLVWVGFPVLFGGFDLAVRLGLAVTESALHYSEYYSQSSSAAQANSLISPVALPSKINAFGFIAEAYSPIIRQLILDWFLLVGALWGALAMAVPVTVAAIVSRKYRGALRRVAVDTAKSSAITMVIALLVELGYQIRLTTASGFFWLTIFGVLTAFMIAHDEKLALLMEEATMNRSASPTRKEPPTAGA